MMANVEPSRRGPGSTSPAVVSDPRRLGLVLMLGLAFAGVTGTVMADTWLALDRAVLHALAGWRSPWMLWSMRSVTTLGGTPWVPALLGVLSLVVWHVYAWRVLLYWAGYTLGGEGLFLAIRVWTHRPRPHSPAVAYPSGHTLAAVCVYGLVIYFVWPGQGRGRWYRRAACGGLLGLIVGVGFSRLILEIHWLSDVVGAYLAGGCYLLSCAWLFAGSSRRGRPDRTYSTERAIARHQRYASAGIG